jgi:hypothetical protein
MTSAILLVVRELQFVVQVRRFPARPTGRQLPVGFGRSNRFFIEQCPFSDLFAAPRA